jgi:hypothetical protein
MTENAKTITFIVVGLLAIALGLATRPSSADLDVETLVGRNLTPKFSSPEDAKRLRIVRFDEDTATLREFEVAEQDGLWTIPSKNGYPADAARQMAEAATSLMDRKILRVESSSASDHEQYGVVDPLSPKLEPGQKGVGTRVTMSDSQNKPLADLIIGKPVKDAEGQRYVREAGRDVVYVIEIDPSKLSTNFENWIEKDLLKLNPWDLQQVEIKDYSAELVPVMTRDGRFGIVPQWDPRAELTLRYNDSDGKWSAVRLRRFDPKQGDGEYVDFTLAEDEELNEEKLNGLKNALDDLQIVDVVRKPAGLSKDLKAGEDFMNNREALESLSSKGFTAAKTSENGPLEIISSDGEVIATMKNGTEYVLRFGNLTNIGNDGGKAADGEKPEGKAKEGEVNRYLFVMARFNEDAIKKPELQPLPELPAEAEAKTESTTEQKPEQPAEPQPEGNTSEDSKAESGEDKGEKAAESAPESPAAETAKEQEAEKAEQSSQGDNKEEAAESADAGKDEKEKKPDIDKIIAERKRIEQENQRKLDEYQELRKKGEENVKELNLRFGDWYFVVSDGVFRKIRLSRDDVIKKKEKKEDEAAKKDEAQGTTAPSSSIPGLPDVPGVSE